MPRRIGILARNILCRQIMVGITAQPSITGSGLLASGTALGDSGNDGPGGQDQRGALLQNNAANYVAMRKRGVRGLMRDVLRVRVLPASTSFGFIFHPESFGYGTIAASPQD